MSSNTLVLEATDISKPFGRVKANDQINLEIKKGFVASLVMIFGRWNTVCAWSAALLFGHASAIQTQFQFSDWLTNDPQFIGIIPFVVTIVVLAGFVGRARPPASIGQHY